MAWDVFISHASEDKDEFVRPLAQRLSKLGIAVWYDEFSLSVGDSLRRSIDRGLAESRVAIVVLSAAFFRKAWPARELDGLIAREISEGPLLLPVWHGVSHKDVLAYSPPLADRVAANSESGIDRVAQSLAEVITRKSSPLEEHFPPFKIKTEVEFFNGPNAVTERAIHLLNLTLNSRLGPLTIVGGEPTFEDPFDEEYWDSVAKLDSAHTSVTRYVSLWGVSDYRMRSMFSQAAYTVWIKRLKSSVTTNPNCHVFHSARAPSFGARYLIANADTCLDATSSLTAVVFSGTDVKRVLGTTRDVLLNGFIKPQVMTPNVIQEYLSQLSPEPDGDVA